MALSITRGSGVTKSAVGTEEGTVTGGGCSEEVVTNEGPADTEDPVLQ